MSFIYGIIDLDKKPVKQSAIYALGQAVKWEGFNEKVEENENYAVGFCHHPEREPKGGIYKSKEVIVLADIRIYNTVELRKLFDFEGPEEAFAKAFLLWGGDCANQINGDFAAVVIDLRKNEVHLFRDHIGTRPLTYWFHDNLLIFASHEFGLVKSGLVTTALNEESVINTFFKQKGKYAHTVFQDIRKVVPGYFLSFSPNGQRVTKYWKPEEIGQDKSLSFEEAVSRLRQLMVSAVLNRMEAGKMGTHVSGGIDSTGVASIVTDHLKDKSQLIGYSWTPEKLEGEFEGLNEKELIEAFSAEKGVPIKYLQLEENESVRDSLLPEFELMHIEHPTMKMAAKDGIQTLFSGWGGDEFVSLSTRGTYNHLFFSGKWVTLLHFIRKAGIKAGIMRLRTEVLPLLIPFGLLHTYQPKDWSNLHCFTPAFICKHWKLIFFHRQKNIFGYGNRTRFMINLLENYHLAGRMDNWAMHSERYGFDYKYPLLDKDLLEFWFSIPVEYTYRGMQSRLLYREAMKGILTENIRTRKNKDEALFITYLQQNKRSGENYVKQLFMSIPKEDHIPFFRPGAFIKVMNQVPGEKMLKEFQRQNKPVFYLRYVELVKKYLS